MDQGAERRQGRRVNIPGGLRASMGLVSDLRVINLSLSGALIQLGEPLSVGQPCTLVLFLSGMELRLPGHVAWCALHSIVNTPDAEQETRYRAGLYFAGLPEGMQTCLKEYLALCDAAEAAQD